MSAKLIHWRSTPAGVCARKDSKVDQEVYTYPTSAGEGTITYMGEADFYGNVTCETCRAYFRVALRR